jgi:hypothetical protein
MPFMSTRITAMLDPINDGPNRHESSAPLRETPEACSHQDCSWHNSSFELARGLEVIEFRGLYPDAFADLWPALRPARA